MKVLCSVILLLAAVASCHSYSYLIPAKQNQAGVCYFNGHVLPKGDTQMPTACQSLRCNDDGSILVQGCGRLNLKGCTLLGPTKNAASYPDCCEMNYECRDRDGRVFMRQWNQLKDEGGRRGEQETQSVTSTLQQTSEAINAAQELLDQVRQQAQRDGRIDLGGQSDRVESELLILRDIVERQGQQINRSPLDEVKRQALDQTRRIQLARMEDELNILVKMSKGMVRLSEGERLKDERQAKQDVKSIIELIQKQIEKRGGLDDLKLVRLEEELQKLALLKGRQARQIQQGDLDQVMKERLDQQIMMQTELVDKEMKTLLRMYAEGNNQPDKVQICLERVVGTIQRQIRLQTPEVRVQLSRAQAALEILSQMKARLRRITIETELKNQEKEIKAQRQQAERELKILAQKWSQKIDASQPIQRIIRLVKEEVSRLIPLQTSELNAQLKKIEEDLQILEQIDITQDREDQEIILRRDRVEEGLRVLLKMLVQGLRQVGQGSQIEQDVLAILVPVRDQIQRSGRFQIFDQAQVSQEGKLRQGDRRQGLEEGILRQVVHRKRQEQEGEHIQGILRQRQGQEVKEMQLDQEESLRQVDQRQQQKQDIELEQEINRLTRILLDFIRDRLSKELSIYTSNIKVEVSRLQNELQMLAQIRARQAQLYERGDLTQGQAEIMQQEVRIQKKQIEKGMMILVQKIIEELKLGDQPIQDPMKRGLLSYGSLKLKEQVDRVEQDLKVLDQIQGQQGQLGQELKMIVQREEVEREVRTLLQMWTMGMKYFAETDLSGKFEQDFGAILNLVGDLIQRQGRSQFPSLQAELNRIQDGLKTLDQMKRRQGKGVFSQFLREEEEIKSQDEQVKSDLFNLLQILAQGLKQDEIRQGIRTVLGLQMYRIREDRVVENLPLSAQLSSVEEELRVLGKIDARLIRQTLEGRLGEVQEGEEIKMQLERVKKSLMTLLLMFTKQGDQIGLGDRSDRFVEEALVVVDLIKFRIEKQERFTDLRAQLRQVELKVRTLAQIKNTQVREGIIGQELNQEKREQISKGLTDLLQMIGEKMEEDDQIEREALVIMDLVRSRMDKEGRRQIRQNDQISGQWERVEMKLKALDQLKIRQDQQGVVDQTEQRQQKQEKQLQREQVEKELRALLIMMEQEDEKARQPSSNPNIIRVKLFKNVSDRSIERKRLEEAMRSLEQLKDRLSTVSEADRPELEQQISMQRDRIERELRGLFKIRAMQDALEEFWTAVQSKINREGLKN